MGEIKEMADITRKGWVGIILLILFLSIFFGAIISCFGVFKESEIGQSNPAMPPPNLTKKIVCVTITPTPIPIVVPTPRPTWSSGECKAKNILKMTNLNLEELPGNIDPVDVIDKIDWFNGSIREDAFPSIVHQLNNYDNRINVVINIDGGILNQVIMVENGDFICANNVSIGRWKEPQNIRSISVDNPTLKINKQQLFLFGNKQGRVVAIGFDKDGSVIRQIYHVPGSDGGGGSAGGAGGGDSGGASSPGS
jgi:hypothetical protein